MTIRIWFKLKNSKESIHNKDFCLLFEKMGFEKKEKTKKKKMLTNLSLETAGN